MMMMMMLIKPTNCFQVFHPSKARTMITKTTSTTTKTTTTTASLLQMTTTKEHDNVVTIPKKSFSQKVSQEKIQSLQKEATNQARQNHDSYAMNALFVNIDEKTIPIPCTINTSSSYSSLPNDLPPGCLLRIGPNGGSKEDGFLDGDGMIHTITIPPSPQQQKQEEHSNENSQHMIMYSCTYVQTNGRTLEQQSQLNGQNYKFKGTLGAAPYGLPMLQSLFENGINFKTLTCQKDTCNTAMARSGDRVLALMEQSRPCEIQIYKDGRMETLDSMLTLNGCIVDAPITGGNFGAHGRTCPESGERIHVSYNTNARPFVKVDTFTKDWVLKSSVGVDDINVPVMVHDCAISKHFVIIMDFPLTVRPKRFLLNQFPVEYESENGARIGLIPRSGQSKTLWFDVDPGVVLHLANAYENSDGHVVIHGAKAVPNDDSSYILEYSSSFLHEWILDPVTNEVLADRCINANNIVEFPAIGDNVISKQSDYCYTLQTTGIGGPMKQFKTPQTGVLLDGLLKFSLVDDEGKDIEAGDVIDRFLLSSGWHFVSEPTVVTKIGKCNEHYVLMIATEVPIDSRNLGHETLALEMGLMKSQFMVFDGNNISQGPVCIVDLPSHVNYGLHSLFVPWDCMK